MKTIRNKREMTIEQTETSLLRQLFELKIQLESEINTGSSSAEKFRIIASAIDQLLTELLQTD